MTDEDIKIKMTEIMTTKEMVERINQNNNMFKKIKVIWKSNRVKDKEITKQMPKEKTINQNKTNLRKN